ncbi:hypothetical protein Nepgr_025086 [Nepenthes gracilis]|uniref:Uncharacterized protein n=1 Tax=Nepenthes gracilis TaxID=150966 RepID=A0AAD3T5J2_NEPGR|nr:hypothetical protein Nepgr_025086 [Nepenthes gracilis]
MPFLAFPGGRVTIDLRSLPLDQLRVRVLHAFPRDFLFIFSYSHQKGYIEILVQLRLKVRKKLFPVRLVTGLIDYVKNSTFREKKKNARKDESSFINEGKFINRPEERASQGQGYEIGSEARIGVASRIRSLSFEFRFSLCSIQFGFLIREGAKRHPDFLSCRTRLSLLNEGTEHNET